jgi:tripartite-type tricarboxylate transporter receptor subunit TctC
MVVTRAHIGLPAVIALAALCAPACAQRYPDKPIRLIVGTAPGGSMDALARDESFQSFPRVWASSRGR